MEEEEGIVIPCKHMLEETRTTKRVIRVQLLYKKFERTIDCTSESESDSTPPPPPPYIRNVSNTVLRKTFKQASCNPVDCQQCKSDIIDYFTSVIAHPNPDGLFSDLCAQLDDYIHQGIPSAFAVHSKSATAIAVGKLGGFMLNTIREQNPVLELASYDISNYTERHYLDTSDSNREWCVTWLGARNPQPRHPRPQWNLNLEKVDRKSLEDEDFRCPICFGGDGDLVALPCQHIFHRSCISLWLEGANSCPRCCFQLPSVCVAWDTHPNSSTGELYARKYDNCQALWFTPKA